MLGVWQSPCPSVCLSAFPALSRRSSNKPAKLVSVGNNHIDCFESAHVAGLWHLTSFPSNNVNAFILERISTRVVVVVVVVVAQPDCLPTLVRMSQAVTEPKSHSSLPKHLPLHRRDTWESSSSDKLYNSVFSGITGHAMLVKLKTHSAAAQWLLQSVAPLRSTILTFGWTYSIGLHRKAKTAIK